MLRIGSRVYHKVFGAGNILALYHDYAEIKFDECGRRLISLSFLSERPFVKEQRKKHGPYFEGQIVYHRKFGKGIIKTINEDSATVLFDNFGEKRMIYEALSLKFIAPVIEELATNQPNITNNSRELKTIKITNLEIIEFMIDYMRKHNQNSMPFDECAEIVRKEVYPELQTSFIKLNALDPSSGRVFLTHLIKRQAKIYKHYMSIITVAFQPNALVQSVDETEQKTTKITNIDAFENVCIKAPFNSTVKMYMARAIIQFCSNVKVGKEQYYVYKLEDLAKNILRAFLYQVSVGNFKNESVREQPLFYRYIVNYVDDNEITKEEEKDLIARVSRELSDCYINQFIQLSVGQSNEIYIPYPDKIVFQKEFVNFVKKKADELEQKVLYRLFYFLEKINENTNSVKAYESNLRRGLDKNDFVYKFEYEKNLNSLKNDLVKDLFLKNEFKELMRKHGIPNNDMYLRMCLDRLDYSLKTKRIILSSKYPSLKAYYRDEILNEEIYRYSNPLNLDEYDKVLKSLQNELLILEVGNGVYLTRKNLEKNGINDETIQQFSDEVRSIGHKLKFFSVKELSDALSGNPVIEYCGEDQKQLQQFVKPIPDIKVITIGKTGMIFSFSTSKNYREDLISFIMDKKESIEIYDIKDFVEDIFNVEYPLDDVIRDIGKTDFYYSEDMEKVYRSKEDYIREVYYGD